MTRLFLALCVAGTCLVQASQASAQSTQWTGIMDATVDTNGACGDEKGNKHVLHYRPYLTSGDPPSAIVMEMSGATIYLQNKNVTAQFSGSGTLSATVIASDPVMVVKTANGTYNLTADPAMVSGATTTIKVSAGTVNVTIPGLGTCSFKFRSILTPAPSEQ